jgi:hypothetical protein
MKPTFEAKPVHEKRFDLDTVNTTCESAWVDDHAMFQLQLL